MADFLLEIGTEEIPDWMIEPALVDLRARFQDAFGVFGGSALITEATPRRLVLLAKELAPLAPDVESVVLGPYLSAGEKAVDGFARKQNTTVAALAKTQDAKGERYVFHRLVKGQSAVQGLAEKLPGVITGLHFPKSMYWTGKGGVRFIRPIRWLVALLDDQVVPFEIAGVPAGRVSRGHRILGSAAPIPVTIAGYFDQLLENFVIVRVLERRLRIAAGLGPDVHRDEGLLDTLVYLTEYPTLIRGTFDDSFLELPREILATVMRHHQRYFTVTREDGSLAPHFVAVTNTNGDPDGLIRQGNERVLRARFNDARFFWKVDQQKKLIERVDDLAKVTFHAKLGSYKEKTERVTAIARDLAAKTDANVEIVSRAALLCKCDLTTDMVKEFTELQGVVGGLYAEAQGENKEVADAIYDHYKPISMEDSIPRSSEGQVLSVADKLDTLRECFREGLIPTGSKDPLALRRAAQGVVKILFEAPLPIELDSLSQGQASLRDFMEERIKYYLREIKQFAYDEVNAVLGASMGFPADLEERLRAVQAVRATADFEPLAASFKRIKNIISQAGFAAGGEIKEALISPGPEQDLYKAFLKVREATKNKATYREKLLAIASLRPQVDLFFDKILVNDPDPAIRQNRLALLWELLTGVNHIADLSEIVTQGASA
jgi:glycyl-tRNA synthetase beta chain